MKRASKTAPIFAFAEHFSRRMSGSFHNRELTRLQWSALRYYARAHKKARTVQGFAAAQGISSGRAAQIVRQLRRKRLLSCKSRTLAPAESIKVTAAGTKLLRRDPQLLIRAALTGLSVPERRALLISLKRASAALARSTRRTTHLLLAAAAGLFNFVQGKEPQAQNVLAQSACDLLTRFA